MMRGFLLVKRAGICVSTDFLSGGHEQGCWRDDDFSRMFIGGESLALMFDGFTQERRDRFGCGGGGVLTGEGLAVWSDECADFFARFTVGVVGQNHDGTDEGAAADGLFNFFRIDIFPFSIDDEGFRAAADGEITLCIDSGKVAGFEPVAIVDILSGFIIVPVAAEGNRAAYLKLSNAVVIGVVNTSLDAIDDGANGTYTDVAGRANGDDRSTFGEAVSFGKGDAHADEVAHNGWVGLCSAYDNKPKASAEGS